MARRIYLFCDECKKVAYVGGDIPPLKKDYTCVHKSGLVRTGRSAAPLTTYFESPDGKVYIPGKEGARMPERLKKLGYQEKTIQNSHQYSQFCKRMDADAKRKHDALMAARDAQFSERQREERAELRRQMQTQFGKDYLEAAIAASERGYGENYSAGSHLEGFEYDGGRD